MTCPATNGTYRCHRASTHRGDHASMSDGYIFRWGGKRGAYSMRAAPILERAFADEVD